MEYDKTALKIQQTGVRLALSQTTIATSIAYYYKFKEFGPISSFSTLESASACIFLASKVSDEIRKIRDILNCWKEADGNSFDKELTKDYYKRKERIVECEQVILRTFVFDVETNHPYTYYLNCCKSLKVTSESVLVGWSILLDSYIYNKQSTYSNPLISVAAVYLSTHITNDNTISNPQWWTLFGVSDDDLYTCCDTLLQMYEYLCLL